MGPFNRSLSRSPRRPQRYLPSQITPNLTLTSLRPLSPNRRQHNRNWLHRRHNPYLGFNPRRNLHHPNNPPPTIPTNKPLPNILSPHTYHKTRLRLRRSNRGVPNFSSANAISTITVYLRRLVLRRHSRFSRRRNNSVTFPRWNPRQRIFR
jgi:hypothetical protein